MIARFLSHKLWCAGNRHESGRQFFYYKQERCGKKFAICRRYGLRNREPTPALIVPPAVSQPFAQSDAQTDSSAIMFDKNVLMC
jgi:hypothetical protein